MTDAYLGLGSNLGDRQAHIQAALEALAEAGLAVGAASPLYESEPWGLADQPRFLNAACAIETVLSPLALLDLLQAIEREMGREPGVRYGPRPIDLDILLYGGRCLQTPRLVVPHPAMLQRAFVLVPLADIAPDARHPCSGLTIAEHLARLGPTSEVAPYPPGLPGGPAEGDQAATLGPGHGRR